MITLFEKFIPFVAEPRFALRASLAKWGTRFDRSKKSVGRLESASRFRYNQRRKDSSFVAVGRLESASRFRYNQRRKGSSFVAEAGTAFDRGFLRVRVLFCILGSIFAFTPLQASDFQSGIEAYHNSEYTEAAGAFESALASEPSAAAHHNLALSYYQLGEPAKAVRELERAVRLDPLNESYLFKLGALRQQLGLYELSAEWWQSAARLLPQSTWIWIVSLSAWVLLAAILLPRISGKNRPITLKLTMGLGVVALLLSSAALTILTTQQADGVVVSGDTAALHHAPASAAPESGVARPGERARLLDAHGDFLKIETEAQITGWIRKDAFGRL